MSRFGRWPVAVSCLGLGMICGFTAHPSLIGQAVQPEPPPVPRELTSFSPVVKRVLPAVVSIEGKAKAAPAPKAKADARPGPQDELGRFFDNPDRRQPEPDDGFGSGVLIDPAGVVLTNHHVVADAESVEVTLADGRKFASKDIRRDPKSDLAIIRLDAKEPLPFLLFADSDAMEVGDRVLAVGAPFGLTGSVTHGIVSAKSRTNLRLNLYEDFIQTDAAVNPGNSGGPLVNLEGKIVGLNAAIKTRSGGFSGVGLAVSGNLAKVIADQLVKTGTVRRGYLGAGVRDIDAELAAKLRVKPNSGAVVTRLFDNSPAGKAGLVVGDIITSVAGQPVRDSRDVQKIVTALPIDQPTEVAILRDGKPMVAKVVIAEQPEAFTGAAPGPAPAPPPAPDKPAVVPFQNLGFAVADLTPDLLKQFGYPPATKGVAVISVARGGAGDRAGLRTGQVVVKVDRTPVTSTPGFQQAIGLVEREKGALLYVQRPNGEIDFVMVRVP